MTSGTATLLEVWRANGAGMAFDEACSSPTVGAVTSPSHYALVWVADGGATPVLRAFNALDGTLVYHSDNVAADNLGGVPHYPPVTCAGASVYVGTANGFALYRANHKIWKDLKPEIKEHKDIKEFKLEHKEQKELVKVELDQKQLPDWVNPKDLVEGDPGQRLGGDPYEAIRLLAQRVDELSEQVAKGRAFIRPEERPPVGEQPLKKEP